MIGDDNLPGILIPGKLSETMNINQAFRYPDNRHSDRL
jgi:hypothetical protein